MRQRHKDLLVATSLLERARSILIERGETHGSVMPTQSRIAAVWNAYLEIRRVPHVPLDAEDVTALLMLMKLARMQGGGDNVDNDVDLLGYCALLGETRAHKRTVRDA